MKKALIGSLIAGALLAYACGAEPLYREERDVIVTVQAEGSDFSGYETYYLPDSIVELCLQPQGGTPTSEAIGGAAGGTAIDPVNCIKVDHGSDAALLDLIEERFDDLGYARVTDPESADVAILVGLVSRVSWNLGLPFCYPNYYYGGCVDPVVPDDFVFPAQTLLIQMIDVEASSHPELAPVWTVALNQNQLIDSELGTSMGGGPSGTRQRIMLNALEQAFEQSPYLAEGGQ